MNPATRPEENYQMLRTTSNTKAASFPATLHLRAIRFGLALAVAASLLAFVVRAGGQ